MHHCTQQMFEKTENKRKRGRGWSFLKESPDLQHLIRLIYFRLFIFLQFNVRFNNRFWGKKLLLFPVQHQIAESIWEWMEGCLYQRWCYCCCRHYFCRRCGCCWCCRRCCNSCWCCDSGMNKIFWFDFWRLNFHWMWRPIKLRLTIEPYQIKDKTQRLLSWTYFYLATKWASLTMR